MVAGSHQKDCRGTESHQIPQGGWVAVRETQKTCDFRSISKVLWQLPSILQSSYFLSAYQSFLTKTTRLPKKVIPSSCPGAACKVQEAPRATFWSANLLVIYITCSLAKGHWTCLRLLGQSSRQSLWRPQPPSFDFHGIVLGNSHCWPVKEVKTCYDDLWYDVRCQSSQVNFTRPSLSHVGSRSPQHRKVGLWSPFLEAQSWKRWKMTKQPTLQFILFFSRESSPSRTSWHPRRCAPMNLWAEVL